MRTQPTGRRLLLPLAVALAIVGVAPFFGLLRDALLNVMPRAFAGALSVGFAAVLLVAGSLAVRRIKAHRWLRIGGCLLAAGLVGIVVWLSARGPADVSAVERFHILEYGLLAALFYWALRQRTGRMAVPLALLAAAIVGVLDETVQWLVPTRVGEMRDILLNWSAAAIGLLAAVSVSPPRAVARPSRHGLRIATGVLAAALILLSVGFFDLAHLGVRIVDREHGLVFRSWFPAETLRALSMSRAHRWAATVPDALRPLSREDYFLTEATSHVRWRNRALRHDDLRVAWGEERILESWYAPVLRLRGLESGTPMALGPAQRQRLARARGSLDAGVYVSPALARRLFLRPPRALLWWLAGGVAMLALLLGLGPLRRGR